ncbi:MAG: UbiA family prenyltransferase [Parvularculaceae bacterium]
MPEAVCVRKRSIGALPSALSIALLALASNYVAAGLLAFTIFFYVVIYSMWLSGRRFANIVIGGAAGALSGCAGRVEGRRLDAWILFLIIFLWTPPHFWALALYREGDYAPAFP